MARTLRVGKLFVIVSACLIWGCRGPNPPDQVTGPVDVVMIIDDGATATADTLLKVQISADNAAQMQISLDSTFTSGSWLRYDTLVYLHAQRLDGVVTVFGRFESPDHRISRVHTASIILDFSARIYRLSVLAQDSVLQAGATVDVTLETRERGRAWVSFGLAASEFLINDYSEGVYSSDITIPNGLNGDDLVVVGHFIDSLGNRAVELADTQRFAIRGDTLALQLLGEVATPSFTIEREWVSGSRVFLTGLDLGLAWADVREPHNPFLLGSRGLPYWPSGVSGNNSLLAVADGEAGIALFSIAGGGVEYLQNINVYGQASDVLVQGTTAYIACVLSGFWVCDVSNGLHPEVKTRVPLAFYAERLELQGAYVWISGGSGVACIRLNDPRGCKLLWELPLTGIPTDLIWVNDRLYVGTRDEGLKVVDVTNPEQPTLIDSYPEFGRIESLCYKAPYLFITTPTRLIATGTDDAENLTISLEVTDLKDARSVVVSDRYLYLGSVDKFSVYSIYSGD